MKIAKALLTHPAILECEISQDSDYKYEIFLKEDYRYTRGRMAGCRTGFFHNVAAFLFANPLHEAAICIGDGNPITECKGAACASHKRCCWQ